MLFSPVLFSFRPQAFCWHPCFIESFTGFTSSRRILGDQAIKLGRRSSALVTAATPAASDFNRAINPVRSPFAVSWCLSFCPHFLASMLFIERAPSPPSFLTVKNMGARKSRRNAKGQVLYRKAQNAKERKGTGLLPEGSKVLGFAFARSIEARAAPRRACVPHSAVSALDRAPHDHPSQARPVRCHVAPNGSCAVHWHRLCGESMIACAPAIK